MTTTPAPKGADIEQQREEFEALARQRGLNTARTKAGDRYRWHVTGVAWEFWLSGVRRESVSGSSTSTSQGAEPDGFSKLLTEAQIIAAWDAQWRYHGHEPCKVGHVEFGRTVEVMVATRCRAEGGNTSNEGGREGGLLAPSESAETRMDASSEGGHLVGAAPGDALTSSTAETANESAEARTGSGFAPDVIGGDALDAATITVIRSAIADYYRALNARQHGDLAMDRSFRAIERELGMSWDMWTRAENVAIAASTTKGAA